ncbi:hypothetical protein [Pontixanthobacter aquaemixtae]|uniref:hypothetical protein n=1 Tax=Pontixanthobacter aquaemixtae TaxID=1958940 RepID=UPI001F1BC91D|nr:hypothetical protein [Pontixanthobacter aquaemixtae]
MKSPTPTRTISRQATSAVAHVSPPPEDDDPLLAFTPYLHTAPRSNSITPDRQRRFIATLAATGIVKQAAKSIGKSLEALYKLRHRPGAEEFSAAWDAALDRGVQRLEDCALERAIQGTSTPIVSGGEILGWWDKPDNALLRFLLHYRLPQKYGAQRAAPDEAERRKFRDEAMESARAYISRENGAQLAALLPVLDHMVANKLAGRAYIAGIDKTRTLRENAEMLGQRGQIDISSGA